MSRYTKFYLVEIQYLGMRYHGWQKQDKLKTIQLMLDKTIRFVWDKPFKILAAGRTDAMVSAQSTYFELFLNEKLDSSSFFEAMNYNLPPDIAVKSIREVDANFNVIIDVKEKTYHYYFAYGRERFPLAASLIGFYRDELDIEKMISAARLFEGEHDFTYFCKDVKEGTTKVRTIQQAEVRRNTELQANFFPPESFVFEVRGKGFGRHQIRLMMGALFQIGAGVITEYDLNKALKGESLPTDKLLAPGSGLMVKEVKY
jgi:tRNA pseudouridine38-40 synthase